MERYLTVAEIADALGVTWAMARGLIRSGQLVAVRVGTKKGVRVAESEMQRFLESHKIEVGKKDESKASENND